MAMVICGIVVDICGMGTSYTSMSCYPTRHMTSSANLHFPGLAVAVFSTVQLVT